jgi:hypothetical protein
MRLAIAVCFAYFLTACQTVGIEADDQRPLKAAIVATTLAADAVRVYGTLPVCGSGVGDACQKPKAYADAKLMTVSFAQTLKATDRPSVFLTAGLLYYQYSLAKRLADAPGPTNPEAAPSDAVAKQLLAMQLGDVLISTLDSRVQDAFSVNTSAADLLVKLDASIEALP